LNTSREISWQEGGNRVPEASRSGTDAIQYGGVLTQYFASVVAVDHEQEGGVSWQNILAYGRPTLESQEKKCRLDAISRDKKSVAVTFFDGERRISATLALLPYALELLEENNVKPGEELIVSMAVQETSSQTEVAVGFRRGTTARSELDDVTVRL